MYNRTGASLLESVYEASLAHELISHGYAVRMQVPLPVIYRDVKLDVGFRIDLLVEHLVIVEIKSVESIAEVHHKQVLTYLRLANKKLALMVNFNTADIASSIFRKAIGL